jgi:hypothetical protein
VISGKKQRIAVQKRGTSTGMTGYRDNFQVWREWDDLPAVKGYFDLRRVGGNVPSVQQSLAPEVLAKGAVVSHIIPVSQKHPPDSSQLRDSLKQRPGGARGINQDISLGPLNQVAGCTKRGGGSEAAVVNAVANSLGKAAYPGTCICLGRSSDRGRGARHQRHQRPAPFCFPLRLTVDERAPRPGISKGPRSDLPTGVAIDAARVDEKFSGYILGDA